MRRVLLALALLLSFMMAAIPATAQYDGTPESSGPRAGDVVDILNVDAEKIGEVSVGEVIDPFEDYDSGYGPERGFRYVAVEVTVSATADEPVIADSYYFSLTDMDGFILQTAWVYPSDDSATPTLAGGEIAPGDSQTGYIFFTGLKGIDLGLLTYSPSYEQLIVVADFQDSATEEGTEVDLLDSDAEPIVAITLDGIVDPMEDYEQGFGPDRGFRCVGAVVTMTNLSDQPWVVESYGFKIVDDAGFVGETSCWYRTEESTATLPDIYSVSEIPAGESFTGMVTVALYKEAIVRLVVFESFTSQQRLILAQYGEDGPEPIEPPVVSNSGGDEGDTGDTGDDGDTGATGGSAECAGVGEWFGGIVTMLTALGESDTSGNDLSTVESAMQADPDAVRDQAAALQDMVDEIEGMETPEIAIPLRDATIDYLNALIEGAESIADAIEDGDEATVGEIIAEMQDPELQETWIAEVQNLAMACPDEMAGAMEGM